MSAEVQITTDGGQASPYAVPQDATVVLTAKVVDGNQDVGGATDWKWFFRAGGVRNEVEERSRANAYTLTLENFQQAEAGEWRATALVDGQTVESTHPFTLTFAPADAQSAASSASTSAAPPTWHETFAERVTVGALVVAAAAIFLLGLTRADLGLSKPMYDEFTPANAITARVIGPVIALGILVVLLGVAMAAIEWRGAFSDKPPGESKGMEAAVDLVKALGTLKGAALVLLSGVVIVLAAAWMTSSAAGTPEPAPSTTVSSEPSASSASS